MANLSNTAGKVQIELSSSILIQLLQSGILHGNDCKCLNAGAKKHFGRHCSPVALTKMSFMGATYVYKSFTRI